MMQPPGKRCRSSSGPSEREQLLLQLQLQQQQQQLDMQLQHEAQQQRQQLEEQLQHEAQQQRQQLEEQLKHEAQQQRQQLEEQLELRRHQQQEQLQKEWEEQQQQKEWEEQQQQEQLQQLQWQEQQQQQQPQAQAGQEMYDVAASSVDVGVQVIMGNYVEIGVNHGRKVFQKVMYCPTPTGHAVVTVMLYYWDSRDSPDFEGWWFGNTVGGKQVWAHCKASSLQPPRSGWKVPWNGAVRPDLTVVKRQVLEVQHLVQGPVAGSSNSTGGGQAAAAVAEVRWKRLRQQQQQRQERFDRPLFDHVRGIHELFIDADVTVEQRVVNARLALRSAKRMV